MSKLSSENSKREIFKSAVNVEKVQTLVDGGNKMTVITPELSPGEMAILFSFRGKESNLFLSHEEIKDSESLSVPDVKFDDESKSPAQRLRSVLYVFWDKNTSKKVPFESFYRNYIEKIIHGVKEKIN